MAFSVSSSRSLLPHAEEAVAVAGADADRVDAQAGRGRQLGRLFRRHGAGVVAAVGEQDQHRFAAFFPVAGDVPPSARRRLIARPMASPMAVWVPATPTTAWSRKSLDRVEVGGERRLEIRPGAEQDQADPVAVAAG